MEGIRKALGNAPVYVVAYIVFMVPTYFLTFAGSNSFMLQSMHRAAGSKGAAAAFWFHLAAMLVLCFLSWIRGSYVERRWLVIFPILAAVFDFVPGLSLIPLVPTAMHLAAIILGVAGVSGAARSVKI